MRKKWEILEEEEAGDTVPANVIIYEDSPELGLAEISFKSEIEPPEKAIVQISGTGQCLSPQLHYLGRQH